MARFSFGLFGQDTNELLAGQKVKIKMEKNFINVGGEYAV